MAFPLNEEQDKFLKEAAQSVKKNAYFMRKAMVSPSLSCLWHTLLKGAS